MMYKYKVAENSQTKQFVLYHVMKVLLEIMSLTYVMMVYQKAIKKCVKKVCLVTLILVSLGTLVPNSRDRQGKLWLLKKQKTALKTTLQ